MNNKLIGSHNSWSYLNPKQWYFRPFAWMAKCQSLTIREQYEKGIRFFDLRVRLNWAGVVKPVHGLTEYKGYIIDDLLWLNMHKGCTVRILLDMRNLTWTMNKVDRAKEQAKQIVRFKDFIEHAQQSLPNVNIVDCYTMPGWEKVLDVPDADILDKSAAKAKLWAVWPWLYAKTHNKKHRKNNTTTILLDYIQL